MMMSVDGRIDCHMVDKISGEEYYTALDSFGVSSKLSGRATAALECSAVTSESEAYKGAPLEAETFHKATDSDEYTIVVDTNGRLQISSAQADGCPLIVVMSQEVSAEHLQALRDAGASFIAVGRYAINLDRALELLGGEFGVKRLVVVGGGNINGGFLEARLIDEVSVMVAPGIDGRRGMTAVFDGCHWTGSLPYRLKLQSVEQVEGTETIWIRYKNLK